MFLTPRFIALLAVFVFVVTACGSSAEPDASARPSDDASSEATSEVIEPPADIDATAPEIVAEEPAYIRPEFAVRPSVNQLHVLGAAPGDELELVGPDGSITLGTVDSQGALLWRDIDAGEYSVRGTGPGPLTQSEPAVVTNPDDPATDNFYASQVIDEGFGYITTRDGTTLSATVWLPGSVDDGPYPTVVEYSGYSPSNPDDATFAQLFNTLGYAYVGVNIRGTGCSGGSFEYFEPVQLTDGYDMIEAVAAQPWVAYNKVGMVGISYPAIAQLFVASTAPPSLAAIAPLSVLDNSTGSTLYPGGLLNTGFAGDWSREREEQAQPYGQGWEQGRVDGGDSTCGENQLLRLQNTDAAGLIEQTPFYVAELADPIAPITFVDQITVPVFLAGAWQDEQTGGNFPAMLDRFTGSPQLYATMVNGSHTESLTSLAIFERYVEFLELYVARRAPDLSLAQAVGPVLASSITGVTGLALPNPSRFAGMSYDEALAAYEAEDRIRILFEEGAAEGQQPGAPLPRFEASFETWPPAEASTQAWYLRPGGSLAAEPVGASDADSEPSSYVSDPDSVPDTFYEGGSSGVWQADVVYDWQPIPQGTGVAWMTDPLADDTVAVGFGSLDLWIRSSEPDADLEVTISEVRPDGQEVYVQTGWLRASQRALDESASTDTLPVHTHLEADVAPLSDTEYSLARVKIFPFAHAFRAGSQIRVTVDAPGGARPIWAFDDTLPGGTLVEIAHDADHQSRLVLSLVPGIEVPPGAPACGSLRSQPCREYVPLAN